MEEKKNELNASRRELLKKAGKTAAFVVPTLVTFQVSTLQVAASTWNNPFKTRTGDINTATPRTRN